MTPQDRSHEVSRIYLAARELPDSDRLAYVQRECAGDEALQRELESLLALELGAWSPSWLRWCAKRSPPCRPSPPPAPRRTRRSGFTRLSTVTTGDETIHSGHPLRRSLPHRRGARPRRHGRGLPRGRPRARPPVALKFLPDASIGRARAEAGCATRFASRARSRIRTSAASTTSARRRAICILTMEYVDGEDLAALLRSIGRLAGRKTIEIARQARRGAGGGARAGRRSIAISSPRNIMIDGDGRGPHHGLRYRRRCRRAARHGDGARHAGVHGAGTARGRRNIAAERHLRAGARALRAVHGQAARGCLRSPGSASAAAERAANCAVGARARSRPGARARDSPVPGSRPAPATGIGPERRRGVEWHPQPLAADKTASHRR